MNHKYSTVILCIFLFVLGIAIFASAISTEDIDEVCNSNNAIMKRINGLWDCSTTNYAEGYYHNPVIPLEINLGSSGTQHNITGYNISNYNGLVFENEGITITKAGLYKFSGSVSFTGGNGGEYGFGMLVNQIPQPDCGMSRTATSSNIGNVGMTCLKTLEIGDHLNFAVKDSSNPTQNIYIYKMNINIMEIQ